VLSRRYKQCYNKVELTEGPLEDKVLFIAAVSVISRGKLSRGELNVARPPG
jgi:hypothetical protein